MELSTQGIRQLLSEALKPERDRTGAWVSGTWGIDLEENLTLEVQVMVPEPEHRELEKEYQDMGWKTSEPALRPFTDVDEFIRFSLQRGDKTAQEIREWCRIHSPHNSALAEGICPGMDRTSFDSWVAKWREMGFADEGKWPGGADRHSTHQPDCPWCVARTKKGIATGSPHVPAPVLTKDYIKYLIRVGKTEGLACGEPVRPTKFVVQDIGRDGALMEVRGAKRDKLWFSRQRKHLAKAVMYRYQQLVYDAIVKRLAIPEDTTLHQLIYGPQVDRYSPFPNNFKFQIIDSSYLRTNLGRVPELQGLMFTAYSPDSPGFHFKERLKVQGGYIRQNKSYVDLSNLETHYTYNYIVKISLGSGVKDLNPGKSTKPGSFMRTLKQRVRTAVNAGPKFHGYWVDSQGNVFTIQRYETGLEGLNFLIDPFMPVKPRDSDSLDEKLKTIPAHSPAWYMGGRFDRVAMDTFSDWIAEEFDMALAPWDQFNDYPIGPDGSIYTVKESAVVVLKDGSHLVGEIDPENTNDDQVTLIQLKMADKTEEEVDEEAPFTRETPFSALTQYIVDEKIVIPTSKIRDSGTIDFDEYDYADLFADYSDPKRLKEYFEESKKGIEDVLPPDEHLNKLEKEKPGGFLDVYGIINPEEPGKTYEWRNPALWCRALLKSLMTPMPIRAHGRGFRVRRGDQFLKAKPDQIFTWDIIEDPNHPDYPYVFEDGQYKPAILSRTLRLILEDRGDRYNELTQQWEGRQRVEFQDDEGVMRYKWIPYNEAAFWSYIPGLKFPEYVASLRRTSAFTQSLSKESELARMKEERERVIEQSLRPTKYVMDKERPAYRRKGRKKVRETKRRSDPFELTYWSKEWFQANMSRIKDDLFPSPIYKYSPIAQYWDRKSGDLPFGWNVGGGKQKSYWPCRKCHGSGCTRCLEASGYVKEYPLPRGVDGENPLKVWIPIRKGFRTRDLWTGAEWIQFLKALWTFYKAPRQSEKAKEAARESKAIVRRKFNELFKNYDHHCLIDKIKREPGKPIDLSGLTELDKSMLLINNGGDSPKVLDEKARDKFITGMIAVNTELFHRVAPPDLSDWYFGNVREGVDSLSLDHGKIRPDVLMSQVSELRNFDSEAEQILKATPDARFEQEQHIEEAQLESLDKTQTTNVEKAKMKPNLPQEYTERNAEPRPATMKDTVEWDQKDLPPEGDSGDRVEMDADGTYGDDDQVRAGQRHYTKELEDEEEIDLDAFGGWDEPPEESMPQDAEFEGEFGADLEGFDDDDDDEDDDDDLRFGGRDFDY